MTAPADLSKPPARQAEPAWEVAHLFPLQGHWSEAEYLALTDSTNRLVEFSHGWIEVLPMPSRTHQRIVFFLARLLYRFLSERGRGTVLFAPLRVRLWEGKIREPDVVVMLAEHRAREGEEYFEGADLVIEVVSESDPDRERVIKRQEYAQAGIPEYWIVEPQTETITVLRLETGDYIEHGRFGRGDPATSPLLEEFTIDVAAMFDEAAA